MGLFGPLEAVVLKSTMFFLGHKVIVVSAINNKDLQASILEKEAFLLPTTIT